ncbi:hypothetical protein IQ07DRAFT_160161 [Pyrenochaeta sp. DS3sAY3a]|nr:hypothetical protein IQ07DRAFT_160161 [Pyrenochaeta sp. DS3sAY3a]
MHERTEQVNVSMLWYIFIAFHCIAFQSTSPHHIQQSHVAVACSHRSDLTLTLTLTLKVFPRHAMPSHSHGPSHAVLYRPVLPCLIIPYPALSDSDSHSLMPCLLRMSEPETGGGGSHWYRFWYLAYGVWHATFPHKPPAKASPPPTAKGRKTHPFHAPTTNHPSKSKRKRKSDLESLSRPGMAA